MRNVTYHSSSNKTGYTITFPVPQNMSMDYTHWMVEILNLPNNSLASRPRVRMFMTRLFMRHYDVMHRFWAA